MSLGKKLFIEGGDPPCPTDSVQPFGADYSSNVALYQLDGNANDTVENHNGTASSSVTYSTGKFGQCAVFNGSSSKIELPSALSNGSTIAASCISFWFNVGAEVTSSTSSNEIMQFAGTSSLTGKIALGSTSGHMSGETFSVTHNVSGVYTYSKTNIPAGWNHAVVQWNSSDGKWDIYINSVKHTTYTVGTNAQGYFKLKFGNRSSIYYTGKLDQVRIYDKALSSNEVGVLYNETTSTASDTNVLDEGSGLALYSLDYDASDAGGNYNGTPTDVTFGVDGQINYGASFNGSTSVIDTGSVFSNNVSKLTYSAWVNFDNLNTQNFIMFPDSGSTGDGFGFFDYGNGNIYFQASNANNDERGIVSNSGLYSTNEWVHFAMVFDGTATGDSNRLKAYVNGNPLTLSFPYAIPSTTGSSSYNLLLGSRKLNSAALSGKLDQVRIFQKALSATEVSTLYGETACIYTSTTDIVNYQGTNLAYYKFDNTALDETTNNHDGTEYNINYEFGRYGQAADFNGTSAYVNVTHNSSFNWTGNKTISLWVKFDSLGSGSVGLAAKSSNSSPYGWFVYKNGADNKIAFSHYNSSDAASSVVSDYAAVTDVWYHICVTGDGTTNKLYINGQEEDSANAVTGTNVTDDLVFGRFYTNISNYYFDGNIDQVRFYESTLDATAVENLYNEKQEAELDFNIALYTGSGTADRYVSNVGFQPDLVWVKKRDGVHDHKLADSVRGATKILESSTTDAEITATGSINAFEANGFNLGSDSSVNGNGNDFVAWCWKGGGDAVSNTNGDITSQVSANQDAGFSIVKYTGNLSAATTATGESVGHGLSSPPELIIFKNTSNITQWNIFSSELDNWSTRLQFDTSQKSNLYSQYPIADPTSSVFYTNYLSSQNVSGSTHIAYCFRSVTGYQKIGIYTGNTTTPPTVNLGFQPRWILIKKTTTAASFNHWYILDAVRDTDGRLNKALMPTLSNQEATYTNDYVDISSSGFTPNGGFNTNGVQHIYLAIA